VGIIVGRLGFVLLNCKQKNEWAKLLTIKEEAVRFAEYLAKTLPNLLTTFASGKHLLTCWLIINVLYHHHYQNTDIRLFSMPALV